MTLLHFLCCSNFWVGGKNRPKMNLQNFQQMDPHLLVGLVNTELRNHAESLEDLVKTHALDEEALRERLAKGGYEYQAAQKQFR